MTQTMPRSADRYDSTYGWREADSSAAEKPRGGVAYVELTSEEQQWARIEQVKFYEEQLPGSTRDVNPLAEDIYKDRSLWRGFKDEDDKLLVNARLLLTHDLDSDKNDSTFDNLQAHISDLDPSIRALLEEAGPARVGELATLKAHATGDMHALKLFANIVQEADGLSLKYILFGLYPDRKKAMSRVLGPILTPAGTSVKLGKFDIDFIPYIINVEDAARVIEQVRQETQGALGVVALSRAARALS